MSNSLDSDQDRHSVGPDLGPICLQRLPADDTVGNVLYHPAGADYCIESELKILSRTKGLDPDQDRLSVGPDLGPNCLQRLSADDNSPLARKELTD